MSEDRPMPLAEHLEELRRRILVVLLAWAAASAAAWGASQELLAFLARPAGGLVFLAPAEAFLTRLKAALFGGFLLCLPVALHQAWAFTARALGARPRRLLAWAVPASYLLFVAGAGLALFLVVPAATRFLIAYGGEAAKPMLSMASYLDFSAGLALAFGAVFQIPLVLAALHGAGLLAAEDLAARRRLAYFAAVAAAALLTPGPDIVSQLALAVPMAALFELSLLFLRLREGSAARALAGRTGA